MSFALPPYSFYKHSADILIAFLALLLLLPLLFIVFLFVRFSLGAPVLFRQQRPGYLGRPFWLLKFRTMSNARDTSGALLPDAQRLTTFGRWLRSSSIDELPGLLNILRGEMSFIGSRPLLMQYLPLYSPEQARRHDVRPGFSGWSQINGRNTIPWEMKLNFDIWYVDHLCFLVDLKILFLTIFKVLFMYGVTTEAGDLMPVFKGSQSSSDLP